MFIIVNYTIIFKLNKIKGRSGEMDNFDDDQDFNSEQVKQIAQQAVEQVVGSDNIVYQKEKVN
jgi:hypothetical protein